MDPVRREPLADQAARLLLERVRAGEWALGAKLPAESALGIQLGVGRSTVREAIRQLAGKGVLQSRQGAGVFVTALDVAEDWDSVLRGAGIISVLEARVAIESEAAALAATRRSPGALRTLRRELARREAARDVTSLDDYVDADMGFHRAMVNAADNAVLLELFDSFVPRLRQAMIAMLAMSQGFDRDVDHGAHAELVEAIASGDVEAARRASRTHLESLKVGLS